MLLASDEWAAEHDLPVLAHFVDAETAAVDYVHGDEGLLDGAGSTPCRGCSSATASALQDFDFYEIHEAFASQVLATLKAWEDPVFCGERLGRDEPLGADRPRQAQRRRAPRWRPATRSRPPAGGSSRRWRSCCTSAARAGA